MSDETILLPCPFCGEEPWEPSPKRWTNAIGDESWSAFVHCPECILTVETKSCGYETAEAAIEDAARKWNTRATVGNGTLTVEQVREAIEKRFDFDVWVPAERWQAIADELNATVGNGTCHMDFIDEYERPSGDEDYLCECSECGSQMWEPAHDLPLYCRKCGKKVER